MKYFNGFSLQHEECFFKAYLLENDYTVAGFSYGAQKAFEYVYESTERVDRLILISPAFFQNAKKSFIRAQLQYFQRDNEGYMKQFLESVASPSNIALSDYFYPGDYEALLALLGYTWDALKVREVLKRGTVIEVFLGEQDKIIDASAALDFFKEICPTYFVKNVGHILQG